MTVTTDEAERRLRETLRQVADQTVVDADPRPTAIEGADGGGGEVVRLGSRGRQAERPGGPSGPARHVWLATAAALLAVVGGLGLWAAGRTSGGLDVAADDSTRATEPPDAAVGAPAAEPSSALIPADDGSLYLVPAAGWVVVTDGESGPPQLRVPGQSSAADEGPGLIAGRPTDSGYENLIAVYQAAPGTFGVDEASARTIDGRTLFDSFDEGVVERLDGGTVVYQAEFGDPGLDEVVAATALVDGQLTFTGPTPSGLQLLQMIDEPDQSRRTVVLADLSRGSEVAQAAVVTDGVDQSDDPALLLLALAGAPMATRIDVDGVSGYAFGIEDLLDPASDGPLTLLAWSPTPSQVVLLQVDLERPAAVALAEDFASVSSREQWESAWIGE